MKEKRTTPVAGRIEIRNVKSPDHVQTVDVGKYEAMKRAFLKALPKSAPGLTVAEVRARVVGHLPEELFPGGAKAGWWLKAVQLDLEARGVVARVESKLLRLHRA